MTTNPLEPISDNTESTDEASTWLLDLVAAVDHLRRGLRPGLTVWDAIEEAVRTDEPDWNDTDPLRSALDDLVGRADGPVSLELQAATRRWVLAAADRYNDGHHWPHPTPRRGFPPPVLDTTTIKHDRSNQ